MLSGSTRLAWVGFHLQTLMFQSSPGWLQRWWTLTARWRIPAAPSSLNGASLSWGGTEVWGELLKSMSGALLDLSPLPLALAELKSLHPGAFNAWVYGSICLCVRSFPSTFPSLHIRSLKSTPYSTGRVANRLGLQVFEQVWGEKWEKKSRSQNQK